MLVVAAVCPQPPLLVPAVGAGLDSELLELRSAASGAVSAVAAARVDLVVVVGSGPTTVEVSPGAAGSLASYGVPVRVALGQDAGGAPVLPLSLTIGAWLLEQVRYAGPVAGLTVDPATAAKRCADVGKELSHRAPRVGMLVMGDGSARRSTAAPGYLDERAAAYDAGVSAALASGDRDALLALEPGLADELLVSGRAPWQVLAGAAGDGPWSTCVGYDDAPYGVGYLAATWARS